MRARCAHIVHKALVVVRPQFRLDFADRIHWTAALEPGWLHGRVLAVKLDMNPGVLAWFAFPHDSQPHNDHDDSQHGQRAADFALRLPLEGVLC